MSEQETKPRRTKTGLVVSDKMDKTVVVAVGHLRRHRLYGRHVRTTRRFKAHDETNECRIGDSVIIEEARPMSHDKRWRVQRVLRSSFVADLDSLKGASDELPEPAVTTDAAEATEEATT